VSESKYKDLLHGKFKPLGYFADEYYAMIGRHERIEFFVKKVWPCIQTLPQFQHWKKENCLDVRRYGQLKAMLQKENINLFKALKDKITEIAISEDQVIKQLIIDIEGKISIEDSSKDTHKLIHRLISRLCDLGKIDMINDYVEIIYVKHHKNCADPTIVEYYEKPEILKFKCFKYFEKVCNFEVYFFGCSFKSISAVLYFFENLDHAWHTPFDKIKAKYIRSQNLGNFLSDRIYWEEVEIIKHSPQRETYSFTSKNVDRCLKFILDDIILRQENCETHENIAPQRLSQEKFYKFSLRWQNLYLRLDLEIHYIELTKAAKKEAYVLKKFNDDSAIYCLVTKWLDPNHTSPLSHDHVSISKLLNATRLNRLVGEMFAPKIGRETDTLERYFTTIYVNADTSQITSDTKTRFINLSSDELVDILKEVANLKKMDNLNNYPNTA